jgi:hypothetical protein
MYGSACSQLLGRAKALLPLPKLFLIPGVFTKAVFNSSDQAQNSLTLAFMLNGVLTILYVTVSIPLYSSRQTNLSGHFDIKFDHFVEWLMVKHLKNCFYGFCDGNKHFTPYYAR